MDTSSACVPVCCHLLLLPCLGNNLYGEDVRKTLVELAGKKEREQYILMNLLRSPAQVSRVFINGAITEAEVVPEIGIFGLYLR